MARDSLIFAPGDQHFQIEKQKGSLQNPSMTETECKSRNNNPQHVDYQRLVILLEPSRELSLAFILGEVMSQTQMQDTASSSETHD